MEYDLDTRGNWNAARAISSKNNRAGLIGGFLVMVFFFFSKPNDICCDLIRKILFSPGRVKQVLCRAYFELEISDRENPTEISVAACSLHFISKVQSYWWKTILFFWVSNWYTTGGKKNYFKNYFYSRWKTGFSWSFLNLISIIWELREKEHNGSLHNMSLLFAEEMCVMPLKYFCSVRRHARLCPCSFLPFTWSLISLTCVFLCCKTAAGLCDIS